MSKIEEMAEKAYPDWEETSSAKVDGYEQSIVRIQRVAFKAGANAVLSEIEKFIKSKEMNGYNYILCEVLKDKIKRLKGE